jgi:hypothetical protein
MAGALYVSLRLGEDWLRAALYLIIFSTLALAGPGRFWIEQLIDRRRPKRDHFLSDKDARRFRF